MFFVYMVDGSVRVTSSQIKVNKFVLLEMNRKNK